MHSLESHLERIADTRQIGQRRIAFFDLDRTLISGYSILALALETAQHAATQGQLRQSSKLLKDVLRHKTAPGGSNYHQVVKRVARAITGLTEATLSDLGTRACHKHLERSLYREAVELVEAHRRAGDHLVIVSAATRYQVEPIARLLGIEDTCCTRLEVQEGRFTGEVVAPLCYGEGKTMAARRLARSYKCKLGDCWFYSDSSADLPLLRAVGYPVAVNPSEKLALQARNRHWPQLRFSSRGKPDLESIARTSVVAQAMLATTAIGKVSRLLGSSEGSTANRLTRLLGDIGSGFAGLDYEVDGREHLHSQRPAIYIFNHQSLLDSMVLAHLLREDVVALCKKEMASNPLVGPLLRQVDTIFVDRDNSDQSEVLKKALAVLQTGRSLVMAPEGTRSTLGKLQPFKMGAFILAKKAGVPIIPIVLHNVKDALPKGASLLRPATIRVTVMAPIPAGSIGGVRSACRELEQRYSDILSNSPAAALPYSAAG
jgi:putative phosphoserine phosphatase / 1-acylglycerol-3-phosphate O-acyltransferase